MRGEKTVDLANGKFHILQLVVKNTSELDFSFPLLWHLRNQYPNCRITIVYLSMSKRHFLRDGEFYSRLSSELGIEELDLMDFASGFLGLFKTGMRSFFGKSHVDRVGLKDVLRKLSREWRLGVFKLSGLTQLLGAIWGRVYFEAERKVTRGINVFEGLNKLSPDLVLLGHRAIKDYSWVGQLFAYFDGARVPVCLLPHAPHQIHPVRDYMPFDRNRPMELDANGNSTGEPFLPDYCDYWCSFIKDELWKNVPKRAAQFPYVGYPAFAPSWNRWLKDYLDTEDKSRRVEPEQDSLHCLLIMRPYLEENVSRPPGLDHFIVDYDVMFNYLTGVSRALKTAGGKYRVIVKPHPSNNFLLLTEILSKAGIEDFEVSSEPFYSLLPRIDLAISMFSTSLLLPIMFGIPSILVHTALQDYVHSQWSAVRNLYEGLSHYVRSEDELIGAVQTIVSARAAGRPPGDWVEQDRTHVRNLFPNDSLSLASQRIRYLLGDHSISADTWKY